MILHLYLSYRAYDTLIGNFKSWSGVWLGSIEAATEKY